MYVQDTRDVHLGLARGVGQPRQVEEALAASHAVGAARGLLLT